MKKTHFISGILLFGLAGGCSKLGIPSIGGAHTSPTPMMAVNGSAPGMPPGMPPGPSNAQLDAAIPGNATALDRAHIHEGQKRLPDAQADLEKAMKDTPDDKQLIMEHAKVLTMQQKRDAGIAELDAYLKKHTNDKDALQTKAQIMIVTGKYDDGMKVLDQDIKLNPKDAALVFDRGCYIAGIKSDFPHALTEFNTAIKLDPTLEDAYVKRGIVYTKMNQNDKAIAEFGTAIKMKPTDSMAHLQRAVLYGMAKQTDKAKVDLNEIIKLNNNPQAVQLAQRILASPGGIPASLAPPGGRPGGPRPGGPPGHPMMPPPPPPPPPTQK